MKITQIRNATQIIQYAGKTFLIDPLLAPKGSYPGFAGTARAEIRNPTVELPCDLTTLLNVDALIVTHLHEDHWDETASRVVPKDKLIYVQNEQDAESLHKQGFTHLTVLADETKFGDITLHKTTGQRRLRSHLCRPGYGEAFRRSLRRCFPAPDRENALSGWRYPLA